jgi:UDP-N-acetylmuramoyl-tripeptide--D-alanyl-D-alanine ligase
MSGTGAVPQRLLARLARALGYWRLRRIVVDARDEVQVHVERVVWRHLALANRRWLRHTTFIAITGSVGKTTATDVARVLLSELGEVGTAPHGINQPYLISQSIARMRRRHRFGLFEVGIGKRGGHDRIIDRSVALIRPSISVVTTIGDDHISAYGSREGIAREKGKLVAALPADGIAVLNADDPLVVAMRDRCRGTVLTYGRDAAANIRAENVTADWPDRLSFDVVHNGESRRIRTQLCGEHWLTSALAGIATAIAAGMPLDAIAARLQIMPPAPQRMEPIERQGVTFVRDDAKAPLWTMPAVMAFLGNARAARKILVVGTLSDYAEHRPAYVSVARQARQVADHVVFYGQWAWNVERERHGPDDPRLRCFNAFDAARAFVWSLLRAGDLVLLKGHEDDHMERFLAWDGSTAVAQVADDADLPRTIASIDAGAGNAAPRALIVGLGNWGERYDGTRHNVGHAVVDRLAERCAARWEAFAGGVLAHIQHAGCAVTLLKLNTEMNVTGVALRGAEGAVSVLPARTILVHDEVKLEPGRIRGRQEGGDGGHLGARSVLAAFEDHRFRRVKVGVGMPPAGRSLTDHVLGRFDEHERAAVAPGIEAACDQSLKFAAEIVRQAPAAVPASSPARAGG